MSPDRRGTLECGSGTGSCAVASSGRLSGLGADVIGNTPAEFSAQIVREREVWAKVVKQAGIKPE